MSDIDTAAADGLKALDLEWPIREADICRRFHAIANDPEGDIISMFSRDTTRRSRQSDACNGRAHE